MGPIVKKKDESKTGAVRLFLTSFIRIRGVLNWSAISFFGFLLGVTSLDVLSYLFPLFVFLVSTFFILAFTFAINNYYDVETDKENPRRVHLNAIASGRLSKRTGKVLIIIFIVIPLVLSLVYSREAFVFCALLLLWMWAYSAPPFRSKGRPGWDIIWHFVGFAALLLWGSYLAGSVSMMHVLVAISIGIFGCIGQIDNHIRDYPFDKASGSITFAVWIGLQRAQTALYVVFIIYIVSLVPLIVLYSFQSVLTGFLLCAGIFMSLLSIQIHKSLDVSSLYRVIFFFGGSVYLTCLITHISSLL